jgi:hypothetical protein
LRGGVMRREINWPLYALGMAVVLSALLVPGPWCFVLAYAGGVIVGES